MLAHDCMDAGGRATQGAVAERRKGAKKTKTKATEGTEGTEKKTTIYS
jgi:hypothetical protein